jgi:hypothetical protein
MKNLLWIIIVAASAVWFWYWGNIQDEVITYNDSVVDLLDKDGLSYEGYLNHLNKYYEGGTVDIVKMREALDALDSTHRGIIIKTGQISVPDHEECTFFHQAFIKYLANSSEIIAKYDELTNYIESHNPGTEVDVDEVYLAISSLLAKDKEFFTAIAEAQMVMAKKFKFEME